MKLFLCEKPSQGRALAAAIGADVRGEGCLRGAGIVVTWCIGHLLELAEPGTYDPAFKQWDLQQLPILPTQWRLVPRSSGAAQLKVVENCLRQADAVVIATDPDREGEMIAREVLDRCGWHGPVARLWLAATDPGSIRSALAALRPGCETEPLYRAAMARACADWLVGLNMTRALTCAAHVAGISRRIISIGRVQTPTLRLVVDRDNRIDAFEPIPYWVVIAQVQAERGSFTARWDIPQSLSVEGLCRDEQAARQVAQQVNGARGRVVSATTVQKKEAPPLPHSLSSLQQEASRCFGLSAQQVLDAAQSLYETHRATSYPRTDCAYLPLSQHASAAAVLAALVRIDDSLSELIRQADPQRQSKCWNDAKLSAHHAIVPTDYADVKWSALSEVERQVYDLIRRRYVAQFFADYTFDQTQIVLRFDEHTFVASGRVARDTGWHVAMMAASAFNDSDPDDDSAENQSLPGLVAEQTVRARQCACTQRLTQPPKHFTDGTLIAAMESVDRFVEDPRLQAILRHKEKAGIGTDATRPGVIEILIVRGYLARQKKQLLSTPLARALIPLLPVALSDPATTALWEFALEELAQGRGDLPTFLAQQREWVAGLVAWVQQQRHSIATQLPAAVAHGVLKAVSPQTGGRKPKARQRKQIVARDTPHRVARGAGMTCPSCGRGELVRRCKKQGEQAGRAFLGCSQFPNCRHFQWAD